MVILVDSFIAAHKVQHKNVEIDFLSILCLLSRMDVAEIWKMPSAAGREEGSSGHFQDALQPTGTELPLILASKGSIIYIGFVSFLP